jgi:hypothetical protein
MDAYRCTSNNELISGGFHDLTASFPQTTRESIGGGGTKKWEWSWHKLWINNMDSTVLRAINWITSRIMLDCTIQVKL